MSRWLCISFSALLVFGCDVKPTAQHNSVPASQPVTSPPAAPVFIAADWDGPNHLLVVTSGAGGSDLVRRDVRSGADDHLMTLPSVPSPAVLRSIPSHAAVVPLFAPQAVLIDRLEQHALTASLDAATSVEWLGPGQLVAVAQGEASDNGSVSLLRHLPDGSWRSTWHVAAPRRLADFSASCETSSGQAVMLLEQDPSPRDPQGLIWSIAWWQHKGDQLVQQQRHVLPTPTFVYGGVGAGCVSAVSIDFDRQGHGSIVAIDRDTGAVQRIGSISVAQVPVDTDLRLSPDGRRLLAVFSYNARPSSYLITEISPVPHQQ